MSDREATLAAENERLKDVIRQVHKEATCDDGTSFRTVRLELDITDKTHWRIIVTDPVGNEERIARIAGAVFAGVLAGAGIEINLGEPVSAVPADPRGGRAP